MLLLDTNVISALMQTVPPTQVAAFVAAQPISRLCTAAVCQAEILSGIAILPHGRRRDALQAAASAIFIEDLKGRILVFDNRAAIAYADLYAMRLRAGRPPSEVDLMIAAIALVSGASVVTRDIGGFEGCGLPIIDPWTASR